ncbi:SET domain-containing protein [Hirsutella rhossiliensis]|uniref:SET domain-containing protein n=1 Tax=Hirsutella rhossiliensis TaxID=111463 RepID=A0A9P8N2P4_9HYPO|nr:SET domain-containing protein [Hirsutella rhossiliensis]KAH0964754.1 SET domain-containing protein [Hirsutella rhossiliensis]
MLGPGGYGQDKRLNMDNILAVPAQSEPSWASEAECITNADETPPYCVFTSHTFANGRGVSILTTPNRAKTLQRVPAFVDAEAMAGTNLEASPPFEERVLPGRGRGLIANKTLHRGDRIFAYSPILVLDEDAFQNLDEDKWIALETVAVAKLPLATRELFWELHGEPSVHPISDRIDTNAFEIEIGESTNYIVVPEIARLNHDCRPNAVYFFDTQTLTHHVHAITDIMPGTEITITYIDPRMPRQQRLTDLYTSWAFNCSCSTCSLHPKLANASDARLAEITALTEHLDEGSEASPQIAQALVSLHHQERLHGTSTNAYRLAALAFCAQGEHWTTVQYARLAVEFGLLSDGFRDDGVQLMMRLAEDPEAQTCWSRRRA